MRPERIARLVGGWVRLYTRRVPAPVARRRIDEIDADLHDHIAHERAHGTGDRRIALEVLSRMVRGLAADASWRRRHVTGGGGVLRAAARVAVATGCILLVPLVAMQVTGEVAWSPFDFAVAAGVLFGTGLVLHLALARAGDLSYRAAVAVALAGAVLLVWLVGAVGVIGETGDRADLMYGAVLGIGAVGALAARFRPLGMARALLATALAQALVAVIALMAGRHQDPVTSVPELLGINGLFVALFAGSAWLFRRAGRGEPAGEA